MSQSVCGSESKFPSLCVYVTVWLCLSFSFSHSRSSRVKNSPSSGRLRRATGRLCVSVSGTSRTVCSRCASRTWASPTTIRSSTTLRTRRRCPNTTWGSGSRRQRHHHHHHDNHDSIVIASSLNHCPARFGSWGIVMIIIVMIMSLSLWPFIEQSSVSDCLLV